ncbi:hypothetical protein [Chryseobacterium sp.]|uniref:hypothetical protein n=1 Tax=Chryseobacterium sp. TaxID=1871047 RepID=UPI002FC6065F
MDGVETIRNMKNIIPDATHVASGLVLINIQMSYLNDIEEQKKSLVKKYRNPYYCTNNRDYAW